MTKQDSAPREGLPHKASDPPEWLRMLVMMWGGIALFAALFVVIMGSAWVFSALGAPDWLAGVSAGFVMMPPTVIGFLAAFGRLVEWTDQ